MVVALRMPDPDPGFQVALVDALIAHVPAQRRTVVVFRAVAVTVAQLPGLPLSVQDRDAVITARRATISAQQPHAVALVVVECSQTRRVGGAHELRQRTADRCDVVVDMHDVAQHGARAHAHALLLHRAVFVVLAVARHEGLAGASAGVRALVATGADERY